MKQANNKKATSRALVKRIVAGDRSAETEAWTLYDGAMRKAAWWYANCEHDVNDRVSTSWEIALPKLRAGDLKNQDALSAYLCGIVRSVSLGEIRKRPWLTISGDTEHLEQALVDHRTPFDAVAGDQEMQSVVDLINDMSVPRDRDVIIMEYFQHDDRESMCEAYEVTPLQMSRWVSRARNRLRQRAQISDTHNHV
ncbi:MAG: RNA polymerase sigma factor [Gammaproteobacteria bacterium]